jgi:hypothetical protein
MWAYNDVASLRQNNETEDNIRTTMQNYRSRPDLEIMLTAANHDHNRQKQGAIQKVSTDPSGSALKSIEYIWYIEQTVFPTTLSAKNRPIASPAPPLVHGVDWTPKKQSDWNSLAGARRTSPHLRKKAPHAVPGEAPHSRTASQSQNTG